MIRTRLGLVACLSLLGCAEVENPSPSVARIRVAHLSPDAPAVDFCIAKAGSGNFAGPVLAGDGGLAGISFGKVTKYFDVGPAQYDVRLVAPASANCASSLGGLPDFTNLPELSDGDT